MAVSSQQQQQHKLSYEQLHHLVHRGRNTSCAVSGEVIIWNHSTGRPELRVHYIRVKFEGKENPLPDLVELGEKVPDFGRRLETDVEWCIKFLECLKSLSIRGAYGGHVGKFQALVEAMKLNSPKYVLQELRGSGLELMDGAASLSSLQQLHLDLQLLGVHEKLDRFLSALESGEANTIWHLGITATSNLRASGFRDSWRYMFTRLCKYSRLKSLALPSYETADLFMEVSLKDGLPRKLQHLQLNLHNDTSGEWVSSIGKTQQWNPECTLTSLHIIHPFDVNDFVDDMNAQPFLRQRISSLFIEVRDVPNNFSVDKLLKLFDGWPKLHHLCLLKGAVWTSSWLPSRKDQLKLLDFLDRRIDCPLETIEGLEWSDKSLERNCVEILKRNKVYRDGGLLTHQMPPTTAKLFICGDSGVGKSTLRKNLTRRISVPAFLQRSKSTVGIRLATLKFGMNTLVLCDLAGQPEFHTLHHYFVRGVEKDLFLLACKAPSATENSDDIVDNQLRYWLRFIVAHRSLSERRPRVFIVLNYFPDSVRQNPGRRFEQLRQDYSDQVDFVGVGGYNFKCFSSVQKLKQALGAALTVLIESRPKVPELCGRIVQEMHSSPIARPKVMSMAEFKTIYYIKGIHNQHLKACITYLHDAGEVVYLESDEDEDEDESQVFIIMDVQWFLRDLIGEFLPRLQRERAAGHADLYPIQPLDRLKAKIEAMCGEEAHVDYILSCLDNLGVTLTLGDSESRDGRVTILPLLQDDIVHWHGEASATSSYTFWGRRFDCKDSDRRLLPFGIFNMLQVRLAGIVSKTEIGKGWLYLVENRIHIVIKIGGTRGEWYDKHWVDVLVRVPFDPDDCFLETGEKLFQQVKKALFELCGAINWGCPSLELEEKVISPGFVERGPSFEFANVHELSRILKKIEENDLRYYYTWPFEEESTQAFQLLLPSERDAYFNGQRGALNTIHVQVEECLNAGSLQPELMSMESSTNVVEDEFVRLSNEGRIISQQIKRCEFQIVNEIKQELKATEERISNEIRRLELVVKKQMERIQLQGIHILSKLQLHLEFEAPKYPFLTNENNFLQRVSSLTFGSTSRLHFLCEHGTHVVEDQKGIELSTPPEWFKKAAPVLVPALRVLFFTLRIGVVVGLGVAAIPTPHFAFPDGLNEQSIDAVCHKVFNSLDERLKRLAPSNKDLEQFHSSLNKFLKGKDLGEELGLYPSIQNGQRVWLCQKHHCR